MVYISEKQIAAVDTMVAQAIKNGGKVSVSKAMRESPKPYSKNTARTPQKLTNSKGFKEIYIKKGLTAGFITGALVEDIKKKPQNRLGEMRLGAEILKMTDKENGGDKTLIINITQESAQRYGFTRSAEENSIRPA